MRLLSEKLRRALDLMSEVKSAKEVNNYEFQHQLDCISTAVFVAVFPHMVFHSPFKLTPTAYLFEAVC